MEEWGPTFESELEGKTAPVGVASGPCRRSEGPVRLLAENRGAVLLVAVIGYALSVLPHDPVNAWFLALRTQMTPPVYGFWSALLAAGAALAGVVWLSRLLPSDPALPLKASYLAVTLGLVLLSFGSIITVNSEIVHFVQYGLLALLLYPLAGHFGWTMVTGTVLGVLDEAYQYFVLHPDWGIYFDFNDVVLNQLGLGLGLVTVTVVGRLDKRRDGKTVVERLRSPLYTVTFVAVGLVFFAVPAGWVGTLNTPDGSSGGYILLNRETTPRPFWTEPNEWGDSFHVLTWWEGTLLAAALILFYAELDLRLWGLPPAPCSGHRTPEGLKST